MTPSGRPLKKRITTVSTPISPPYTHMPRGVTGEVAMSVAI